MASNPIMDVVEKERRARSNPIMDVVEQERRGSVGSGNPIMDIVNQEAQSQPKSKSLLYQPIIGPEQGMAIARFLGRRVANSPAAAAFRTVGTISDTVSRLDYPFFNVADMVTGGKRHESVGDAVRSGLSPKSEDDRGSWYHLLHRAPNWAFDPLVGRNVGERVAAFAGDMALSPTSLGGAIAKTAGVIPKATKALNNWLSTKKFGKALLDNFSTRAHLTGKVPVNTPEAQKAAIGAQTNFYDVAYQDRTARQMGNIAEESGDATDVMNRFQYSARAKKNDLSRGYWETVADIGEDLRKLESQGVDPEDVFRLAEQSKRMDLDRPRLEMEGNISTGVKAQSFDSSTVRPVIEKINTLNANLLAAEKASEAPIRGLNDIINYMTHLRTDEMDTIFKRMGLSTGAKDWTVTSRFQIPRELYGKDAIEANAWIAKNGLDVIINPQTGATRKVFPQKAFKTDPMEVLAVRSMSSAKTQAAAQMFDDVARTFGRPIGEARELMDQGWRALEGANEFDDKFQGLIFHPEVADQLESTTKLFQKDELQEFMGMSDKLLSQWKVGMLAFNVPYHTHNILSNTLLAWKAGLRSPEPWIDAFEAMRGKGVITIKGRKFTGDEIMSMAREDGIVGTGRYGGDIDRTLDQLKQGTKPSDIAFDFQQLYEDQARLATYIDQMKKAPGELTRNTRIDAAMHTMRNLLNYSDLSRGDQAIKRWSPFWTWPRKIVPLVAEAIIEDPDWVSIPAKLKNAIERGQDAPPDDQRRQWFDESGAIRLGETGGKGIYLDLSASLPTATFDDYVRKPAEQIVFGVRPDIRALMTGATGVEFGGREYEPATADLLFVFRFRVLSNDSQNSFLASPTLRG